MTQPQQDRRLWQTCGLLFVALTSVCGCGPSSDKVGISGRVTMTGGKPIERGMIQFSPAESLQGGETGAIILDGAYTIARAQGLHPGKYRVRVYASAGVAPQAGGPGALGIAPPRELVAPRYNTKSQLTAEVSGSSDLSLDFEVEPAGAG